MMRYLGPALRRLFKRIPPAAGGLTDDAMDLQITSPPPPDPIVALGAAVDEHARVMDAEATSYTRRLRATMDALDDVLNRVGSKNANG